MKKSVYTIVLALLFLTTLASAKTLIAGKIYNQDFTKTISNATVTVNCNNHIQKTQSLPDGSYAVIYSETGPESCKAGNNLTVSAIHEKYGAGQVSGTINPNMIGTWDLAIANVPLVPEYTFIIGTLTLLSAFAIFFIIRRE